MLPKEALGHGRRCYVVAVAVVVIVFVVVGGATVVVVAVVLDCRPTVPVLARPMGLSLARFGWPRSHIIPVEVIVVRSK
jgi:hypothetical protein